ncbi:hypothetical protein O181_014248 [Austropuccinia psidii MF-1]|uniref:Uncharacterized protein n=1 Tax=Austropuccinia psidii MF-1 TaxID=1389203 RepID=A0A9Q3GNV6_9BASI|nr:hypothetical protein [Austropuccinia psidii MF-1]
MVAQFCHSNQCHLSPVEWPNRCSPARSHETHDEQWLRPRARLRQLDATRRTANLWARLPRPERNAERPVLFKPNSLVYQAQ